MTTIDADSADFGRNERGLNDGGISGFCCAEVNEIAHELDWLAMSNRAPTSEQMNAMARRLFEVESRLFAVTSDHVDE